MYKLITFNEVSANFTAQFGISISPFFDRETSNKTGKLKFISQKFVKHLMKNKGYGGNAEETLQSFVCRKFNEQAWTFLKRLM